MSAEFVTSAQCSISRQVVAKVWELLIVNCELKIAIHGGLHG